MRSLIHLQELEVLLPWCLDGFESILTQCNDLRSITLDLQNRSEPRFIQALQSHPTAFPHLAAFKLLDARIDRQQRVTLALFLQSKKQLRLLDLDCGKDEVEEGGLALPLLEVLQQLPGLQVLGLSVRTPHTGMSFHGVNISFLGRYIPRQLSALMLRLGQGVDQSGSSQEWPDLVRPHYLLSLGLKICCGDAHVATQSYRLQLSPH